MKNLWIYLIIAVVVILVIITLPSGWLHSFNNLGMEISPSISVTNASSTVTTSASLVLAANSGAQARWITNLGTSTAYLSFYSTSTGFAAETGYALTGSSTLEMTMDRGNLWTGNIYGITAAGTAKLAISQL